MSCSHFDVCTYNWVHIKFFTGCVSAQTVQNLCESILSRPEPALVCHFCIGMCSQFTSLVLLQELTQEERDTVEKEVEELSGELKLKEWDICVAGDQEIVRLKEEIQEVRGTRAKMRSIGSSASSSVTIFPSGTPGSSPEEELVDSSPEEELTSPEEDLEQDKSNKEAKGAHWEEEKKGKEESCVNNLPQKDS